MRLRLDQMVCCNWKAHLVHVCGQPVQPWTVLWRKGKIQILDFNRHGRFEALRVSSDRKHGVVIGMLSFTSEDGGVNQYAANNLNQTVLSFSYWVRLSNCQTLNIHSLPLEFKKGHWQYMTKMPWSASVQTSQHMPKYSTAINEWSWNLLIFSVRAEHLAFWQGQARVWPARYVWTSGCLLNG